jgi:hypothetical protein
VTSSPDFTAPASLWRHRDFRRYLTGQTASVAGSSITSMALPVLAVLELDATTGQVVLLTFLGDARLWDGTGAADSALPGRRGARLAPINNLR